ncbi:hypothetical protein MW887_006104 [Aspergillus wentii]|nr:hypothetical protein MW887_006104 [Aspergillus wentii]
MPPSAYGDFPVQLPLTPPYPTEPLPRSTTKDAASVATAVHVIGTERAALAHLEQLYQTDQLAQENLGRAVSQIARSMRNGGKVVACGVGKSGKIARKIEATMNSVGINSAYLHPTEALHGDLGMVRPSDTLLLISFSGRTSELLLLLPHIPQSIPVIAITSHLHPSTCPLLSFHPSEMGILLPAPIHEDEESSIGLSAPTSSTTVALALGDALAIATARRLHTTPGRGPAEVFKSFHPGGAIGAASNILTPMSMSATSFSSTSLDDLQSLPPSISTHNHLPPATSSDQKLSPPISDILVPLDQIPTVSPSSSSSSKTSSPSNIRFLDILLTAIQNPAAKSWVFLSPSEIIPPRHIRSLSQHGNNTDIPVSDLGTVKGLPFSIHRDDWLTIPGSRTAPIDDIRRLISQARVETGAPVSVVALMSEKDRGVCLGVFEVGDLWDDCG